ncbi:hypothetical protein LJE71_07920, partial [Xanthobacter autotrophicus]|uniref:hypothetical protein n=1 Tax=Xanthobacter autotrophicus TaxID=280 RepID=UPI001E3507DC
MSITRHLARHARERPEAPALTCGGETLTYAALDALAARCATRFAAAPVSYTHLRAHETCA